LYWLDRFSREGINGIKDRSKSGKYDRFNEDSFYKYLKQIHYKFPKCYLFLDKAPQHYKSQKVGHYFEKHKDTLIRVWLPTASPEFMVLGIFEHIKI
jgi:hypothetical protein